MPNLRLVWPTNEELRERHALMDQMMERKGSICLRQSASMAGWPLSRPAPNAVTAHTKAYVGIGWRVTGSVGRRISVPTRPSSGHAQASIAEDRQASRNRQKGGALVGLSSRFVWIDFADAVRLVWI